MTNSYSIKSQQRGKQSAKLCLTTGIEKLAHCGLFKNHVHVHVTTGPLWDIYNL